MFLAFWLQFCIQNNFRNTFILHRVSTSLWPIMSAVHMYCIQYPYIFSLVFHMSAVQLYAFAYLHTHAQSRHARVWRRREHAHAHVQVYHCICFFAVAGVRLCTMLSWTFMLWARTYWYHAFAWCRREHAHAQWHHGFVWCMYVHGHYMHLRVMQARACTCTIISSVSFCLPEMLSHIYTRLSSFSRHLYLLSSTLTVQHQC